jgi:hypothetical protein
LQPYSHQWHIGRVVVLLGTLTWLMLLLCKMP